MSHYRSAKKKLYIGFIDFRKAFDKVWRSSLMYKLLNYCNKWKIDINVSKSKIMITSKKPSKVSHNFMVGNQIIETVKKYKYLGFFLSHTGSVQYAQDHLIEIAVKTWYTIKNGLYNQKVWLLNIYIKSFETVIKPIELYECEIWGQNMINKKDSIMMKMPKFDVSLPCERFHIRVCKQILLVHKKATNIAILAELGRFPLYFDILIAIMKYYARLEGLSNNHLKKVYLTCKELDNRTNNIIQYVEVQLNNTSVNINFSDKFSNRSYIRDMKKGLKQYFENKFLSFLQSDKNKKLSMYNDLKQLYEIEPYITYIEDPTKFRISAHMLRIEKGICICIYLAS